MLLLFDIDDLEFSQLYRFSFTHLFFFWFFLVFLRGGEGGGRELVIQERKTRSLCAIIFFEVLFVSRN